MKVGIAELQERAEVPARIGISIQQVAQQKMAKTVSKCSGKKKENFVLLAARWEAQRKGSVDLEKKGSRLGS